MTHVVTDGTGRAAQIPGMIAGGKTGTTNDSTNAWFNGFTGNLVCSVWFGNDDNTPMENMTGGTLPAQSWHEIMALRASGPRRRSRPMASRPARPNRPTSPPPKPAKPGAEAQPPRATGLSPRAAAIITEIGDLARRDKSRSAEAVEPASFAPQTAAAKASPDLSQRSAQP